MSRFPPDRGRCEKEAITATIQVPDDFAADLVNEAGAAGQAWIDALPAVVGELCGKWGLTIGGAPMNGYLGLVLPVWRGDEACALKVSWPDESTVVEANALRAWNGRGMVRLLESDPVHVALLLERLDHRRILEDVEIGEAVGIAGDLIRRLSVPAPSGLPLLTDVTQQLADTLPKRWEAAGRPMARDILEGARDVARQLGPASASLMVNSDLHYGNVLAGTREAWLAIDPKVVVGDPEYGVAQLLWTRLEDLQRDGGLTRNFDALVERAGLDRQRTVNWTLMRCVDYWIWARSVGLTVDPVRCAIVIDQLCWSKISPWSDRQR